MNADPEYLRAQARAYRAANRARVNAKKRAYRADPERAAKERAAAREWYWRDPERARALNRASHVRTNAQERKRQYAKDRPDVIRRAQRAFYYRHWDAKQESVRAWRAKNPERWRILSQNHAELRRARLKNVEATLTHDEWAEILEYFGHACAYCLKTGIKLEQEHIEPVARGGGHTADNVIPACRSCNATKHDRGILCMVNRLAA